MESDSSQFDFLGIRSIDVNRHSLFYIDFWFRVDSLLSTWMDILFLKE